MSAPNAQPVLPAEVALSDLEKYFGSLQPVNLWPQNQNSNFGLLRLLICEQLQGAADNLADLANEMFITTAEGYLGRWETELGLPEGQGGRTDDARRSALLARRAIGPFTRTRRKNVVESFLQDIISLGGAPAFGPGGITIGSGIPLYSDATSIDELYEIIENIPNFSYTVYILNTVTPDISSMTRELTHITPAHYTFTIDNTVSVLP